MGGTEMQFFKLVGALAAGSGGQGRKRTADENVDLLAAKSETFNKGLRGRAFFYVVNGLRRHFYGNGRAEGPSA